MNFTVTEPQRLDTFLAHHCETISRSRIQKAIKEGNVRVNGKVVKKVATILEEGDSVEINDVADALASDNDAVVDPIDLNLSILYEDKHCAVLNKPAGISVHPGVGMEPGEATILAGALHLFGEAHLVHRIDKDTTGALLIAKNIPALEALQKQFQNRCVHKEYLCIVHGIPKEKEAHIDAPIGRNVSDRTKMSIVRTASSREAHTSYTVLDSTHDVSLLSCTIHTGRTHQIRVHLSSIGHPLIGDDAYGSQASKAFSEKHSIPRVCLHAWKLSFEGLDGGRVEVECDVPEDIRGVMEKLEVRC